VLTSIGSMAVGSLGALKQVRIKRFLAYASINQIGFILMGVASCSLIGLVTSLIYVHLYIVMNLLFFTVFLHSEHILIKNNITYLSDLYGISMYSREGSFHLATAILSMAGLPPLGGFIGKLLIYFSAIEARLDTILIFALIISILSTYYYLNFIRYLFFEKRNELKLFYFVNNTKFLLLLRIGSFFLISFPVLESVFLSFFSLTFY